MAFHPDTAVAFGSGAPYGGYSRACRSRLAKLPIRLLGEGQFNEVNQGRDGSGDDPGEYYFNVRDGEGRLFACAVYHQDDLHEHSLTDSVFDDAILAGEEPPADMAYKFQKQTNKPATLPQPPFPKPRSVLANPLFGNLLANAGISADDVDAVAFDVGINHIEVERVSRELQGVCSQVHQGYWSYEWCHKKTMRQFHVAAEAQKDNPGMFNYNIESVIKLGRFKSENSSIQFQDLTNINKKVQAGVVPVMEVMMKSMGTQVKLTQTFEGGDKCVDAGNRRRSVTTDIRCCSAEEQQMLVDQELEHGDNPKARLLSVDEHPTQLCRYTATVCTPLLCSDDMIQINQREIEDIVETLEDQLDESVTKATMTTNTLFDANTSIRALLSSTLGEKCLLKNEGWWSYEICHTKNIRQFHADTVIDPLTNTAKLKVETEHFLGIYNSTASDDYPTSEEIQHMEQFKSGNAAFVVEYVGGDMCDNSEEIKDKSIKSIARATTVKFSCGKTLELKRVNEDSTCHYVLHVTVPDLCRHALFVAPVVKEQVIKCLPVVHDMVLE